MKNKPFIIVIYTIYIAATSFITSCSDKSLRSNYPITISEIKGSKTEKIDKIMRILGKSSLKTSVNNAYLIEQKKGDGEFGSSDYVSFIVIDIDVAAIPTWRALAPKSTDINNIKYVTPPKPVNWWISASEFKKLEFFDSPITNRHGWLGISPKGKIYIYSYTT